MIALDAVGLRVSAIGNDPVKIPLIITPSGHSLQALFYRSWVFTQKSGDKLQIFNQGLWELFPECVEDLFFLKIRGLKKW